LAGSEKRKSSSFLSSLYISIGKIPEVLEHVGKLSNITTELVRRGYKDGDIKKILGGNFLRVFKKVCSNKKGLKTTEKSSNL